MQRGEFLRPAVAAGGEKPANGLFIGRRLRYDGGAEKSEVAVSRKCGYNIMG